MLENKKLIPKNRKKRIINALKVIQWNSDIRLHMIVVVLLGVTIVEIAEFLTSYFQMDSIIAPFVTLTGILDVSLMLLINELMNTEYLMIRQNKLNLKYLKN